MVKKNKLTELEIKAELVVVKTYLRLSKFLKLGKS